MLVNVDKDGFLSVQQLKRLFCQHNIYVGSDDLEMLVNKFDRDMDCKISYPEFRDELLPKTTVYESR